MLYKKMSSKFRKDLKFQRHKTAKEYFLQYIIINLWNFTFISDRYQGETVFKRSGQLN